MKNKIVSNYLYNMSYQVLNILIPIVTIPYISRVLGPQGIGINDSTYAFVATLAVIGMFGITNYGSKKIAWVRDSKERLSKNFWSIWFLQAIANLVVIIIFTVTVIYNDILGLKYIYLMQLPILIGSLLDISWLYVGLEDFKKTVIRNILVKLLALILILLLVKTSDDLWIYILINSLSIVLGNTIFWIYLPKYVDKVKIKKIDFKAHVPAAFALLVPQLAIQIYTNMDKVMVERLTGEIQSGYYSSSQKIARLSLVVITSLSYVMMPTMANMYAKKELEKVKVYLRNSVKFALVLSIFITSTLMAIAEDFVPMFFGEEFNTIIPYMIISSLIVVFISVGGVFANQYSLPIGDTKEYTFPLIVAAIINPVLNYIFLPIYKAFGGVISIVITELVVFIIRILVVRKKLDLKYMFDGVYKYFFAGVISFIVTYLVSKGLPSTFIAVIFEGTISLIVYLVLVILLDKEIKTGFMKIIKKYK